MYQLKESRDSKYSPKQLYDLVQDVEKYSQFLPWCKSLRIRSKMDNQIIADLQVGFEFFTETFTSIVKLNPETLEINVEYVEGPFKSLTSRWKFHSLQTPNLDKGDETGGARIEFEIAFTFKSMLLSKLLFKVFETASIRMIDAFETRAEKIYS